MAFLTDQTLASGVTLNDLIHVVIPTDVSQNPAGSSYKATIQQVLDNKVDVYVTGGTYSNGTTTFTNNTGGTFNVTGYNTGSTKYFGSFYDTGDQTGLASTVLTMSANTSDTWNSGVTLSADTRFVIENPGVYNLAFSAQMVKTGGNSATHAHIWLSQNGLDVSYSASQVGFPSNSVYVVAAWNFFFETTLPNEYVELKWYINSNVDNQLFIKYQSATTDIPDIPSLIVTINQVN